VSDCDCASCSPIRREIKDEVDSFLDLRQQIRNAEAGLRALFRKRMACQKLTSGEAAMVSEALDRTE
jgi:hypothetical protein